MMRRRKPTDTRPPLHLTAGEAARWFSLHPQDKGREVVIVEAVTPPISPEMAAWWDGFGRWELGLTGNWPRFTAFAEETLLRPPSWMFVDCNAVTLTLAGQEQTYLRNDDGRWERIDSVLEGLKS